MEKSIINQTDFDITVTLYVAELINNNFCIKETHTIDIMPNGHKDIIYGNVVNAFISGIEVCADMNGTVLRTSQKSGSVESPFSREVNQKHLIEVKGLRSLDIELVS